MKKLFLLTLTASLLSLYSCGGGESETKEGGEEAKKEGATTEAPKSDELRDYSAESADNKADRDKMIAAASEGLTNSDNLKDFKFVPTSIKVKGGYAFLMGDVTKTDGGKYEPQGEEMPDCCHAEALLRNEGGNWYSIASAAFSTDVWYACLWQEKKAPKEIFGPGAESCGQ